MKAVLSHMDRGLRRSLDHGTWDAVMAGLVEEGAVGPPSGGAVRHHAVLDARRRAALVTRLRDAAAGDEAPDAHTALLLSMTGPAQLLELVAPQRTGRRHARRRIDHALDGGDLVELARIVRKLISDGEAGAAVAAASG
jgi:hypothetical protein